MFSLLLACLLRCSAHSSSRRRRHRAAQRKFTEVVAALQTSHGQLINQKVIHSLCQEWPSRNLFPTLFAVGLQEEHLAQLGGDVADKLLELSEAKAQTMSLRSSLAELAKQKSKRVCAWLCSRVGARVRTVSATTASLAGCAVAAISHWARHVAQKRIAGAFFLLRMHASDCVAAQEKQSMAGALLSSFGLLCPR